MAKVQLRGESSKDFARFLLGVGHYPLALQRCLYFGISIYVCFGGANGRKHIVLGFRMVVQRISCPTSIRVADEIPLTGETRCFLTFFWICKHFCLKNAKM